MTASPGTLLREWFENVWNANDASRIADYLAPDGIAYALDVSGQDAQGPEAFRIFFDAFMESFSNVRFTIHDVIEQDDRAVARWSAVATHTGDGFGSPASGETVALTGMTMARVQDGMMVEGWNEWDRLKLVTTCRMTGATA